MANLTAKVTEQQAAPASIVGLFTSSVVPTSIGWGTVGIIAPQGEIPVGAGVKIGNLATQTNVKTTWPDGSVKIAFATAYFPATTSYQITTQTLPGGSLTPTWPTASVIFTIGTTTYTAALPTFSNSNNWFNGSLCNESRIIVSPITAGAVEHPTIQVVFDVRSFSDGTHRVDICVQNVRDSASMDRFLHDVSIVINGSQVWSKLNFTTYSYTRWRKTFWVNTVDAAPCPDFESWYKSKLVPRVRTGVTNNTYTANYDVLQFGDMPAYMMTPGGAETIAPMAWWEARYMVHKTASQRAATLGNGNCTGSWSLHITESDGTSVVKVTNYPGYWMDGRAGSWPNGPKCARRQDGALLGVRTSLNPDWTDVNASPDQQHLPSAAYFPYLLTGDRYYLDQTKLWGAWAVISYWPMDPIIPEPLFEPAYDQSRKGSKGYLTQQGIGREMGWPLRAVAQAAVVCPDSDTDRNYFITITQNNLDWLGNYVTNIALAGGITEALGWEGTSVRNLNPVTGKANSLWRLSYTAYAVDYALRQGLWAAGTAAEFRNRVIRIQIGYLTNGDNGFPPEYGCPYYPAVARVTNSSTVLEFFSTWAQAYDDNINYPFAPPPTAPGCDTFGTANIIGYYDVEAYFLLQMGMREGLTGATAAYTWLTETYASGAVIGDVNSRSGFALDFTLG